MQWIINADLCCWNLSGLKNLALKLAQILAQNSPLLKDLPEF